MGVEVQEENSKQIIYTAKPTNHTSSKVIEAMDIRPLLCGKSLVETIPKIAVNIITTNLRILIRTPSRQVLSVSVYKTGKKPHQTNAFSKLCQEEQN